MTINPSSLPANPDPVDVQLAMAQVQVTSFSSTWKTDNSSLSVTDPLNQIQAANGQLQITNGSTQYNSQNVYPMVTVGGNYAVTDDDPLAGSCKFNTGSPGTGGRLFEVGINGVLASGHWGGAVLLVQGSTAYVDYYSVTNNAWNLITLGSVQDNTQYIAETVTTASAVTFHLYVKGSPRSSGYNYELTSGVAGNPNFTSAHFFVCGYSGAGGSAQTVTVSSLTLSQPSNLVAGTRISRTIYDADGHIAFSIDPMGNTTGYQYDANGRVTQTTKYADETLGQLVTNASGVGNSTAGWSGNITVGNASAVNMGSSGYAFTTHDRDVNNNYFAVAPGQVFNVSMDASRGSAYVDSGGVSHYYPCNVGLAFYAADGTNLTWLAGGGASSTATGNQHVSGTVTVPAGAVYASAWVQINGPWGQTGTWNFRNVYVARADGSGDMTWLDQASNPLQALQQRLVSTSQDETTLAVYDNAGRLSYSIDANGDVTGYNYDADGRAVRTTRYSTPINVSALPTNPDPVDVQLALSQEQITSFSSTWQTDNPLTVLDSLGQIKAVNGQLQITNGSAQYQGADYYPQIDVGSTTQLGDGTLTGLCRFNSGSSTGRLFQVAVNGTASGTGQSVFVSLLLQGSTAYVNYFNTTTGLWNKITLGTVQDNTVYNAAVVASATSVTVYL
jgi:YD repeat-containing protein